MVTESIMVIIMMTRLKARKDAIR